LLKFRFQKPDDIPHIQFFPTELWREGIFSAESEAVCVCKKAERSKHVHQARKSYSAENNEWRGPDSRKRLSAEWTAAEHGNELFGKKRETVYFKGVALTLSLIPARLCFVVVSPRCWRRLVCAPGNAAEPDNYVD